MCLSFFTVQISSLKKKNNKQIYCFILFVFKIQQKSLRVNVLHEKFNGT